MYNTTHHVLKRIAVANEVMLAEVKKEVDIMVCMSPPDLVGGLHTSLSENPQRTSQHRISDRRCLA